MICKVNQGQLISIIKSSVTQNSLEVLVLIESKSGHKLRKGNSERTDEVIHHDPLTLTPTPTKERKILCLM